MSCLNTRPRKRCGIDCILKIDFSFNKNTNIDYKPVAYRDGITAFNRQNFELTFSLLEPVAKNGDMDAQITIGVMYLKGFFVARDYAKALGWFKPAAEKGFALAQSNMGMMYLSGFGVGKNPT